MTVLAWVFAVVGLAGLAFGADWLVEGASGLARRFRVSPLVIGLAVVAYGTSGPEIAASFVASLRDSPGLAVGNVIGSNAANLGLALGVTALIRPFAVSRGLLRREFLLMLAVTFLLWPLAASGSVPRMVGAAFLVGLGLFTVWSIRASRRANRDLPEADGEDVPRLGRSAAITGLGLLVVLVGADLLVRGGTDIARELGVSDTTIGFTLVALGTSLPELATSFAAARRGEIEMVAGNVIGSNLFNVLGAMGLAAVAAPLTLDPSLLRAEVPGVLVLTVFTGVLLAAGKRLSRTGGALLLAAYAGYAAFVVL